MALSQLQCLDDNHVNSRINQSKPEFFYSEEQRLALESLLEGGREGFEEFIKTTSVRSFLSDLEVARLSELVEAFGPGSPVASADSEEVQGSLQYWPDRSDTSLPDLDMGWPDCAAYRGVTRAQVYAQPSMEGDVHIKEVVRKTIAQAQKVIAVVMDLFTDADIFKDLLNVSFKRKVPVYLILEATGVPHFLKMCERVAMHTGHLKNLRVRSIRGIEFCSRSSKKVCGSQSQKFMFVDGDKAVSGSYSFTWTASRLDRNIVTVLTGQAADTFDKLFREMYAMSNGVNLNKIKLDDEPKLEPTPQTSSAPLPSATMALKLINPKYALVSSSTTAKSNRTPSERCTTKNENVKQTDVPEAPQIHPGLLHLEKANMIEYLPAWPEPDPPNDVIGFINIRDYNKPLQAHLMRSELFEVSQAIRFKDPFHVPEEPLPEKASPKLKLEPLYQMPNSAEQPLMPPQISPEENDIHAKPPDQVIFPPCSQTEKAEFVSLSSDVVKDLNEVKDSSVVYVVGNQMDSSAKQGEEIYANSQCLAKTITDSSSGERYRDLKLSVNPQLQTVMSSHTSQSKPKKVNSLIAEFETTSVKQNFDKTKEPIKTTSVRDNEIHKDNNEADTNETKGVDMPCHTETPKHSSNISSTSEEYYECSDCLTVDSGFEGTIQGMLTVSGVSEQDGYSGYPNTIVTHSLSAQTMHQQLALMTCSSEHESGSRSMKETEEPCLDSGLREQRDVQHETKMTIHSEPEDTQVALVIEADTLSELIFQDDKRRIQETDASSSESKPLPNSLETITDAQVASSKVCKELSVHELGHVPYSIVNNVFGLKPVEVDNTIRIKSELSKNKLSNSVLQGKGAVPITLVQTKTELQSIVFSDRVKEIPLHSGFTYTSNLTPTIEVKDVKQSRHQEKLADLRAVLQMDPYVKTVQEENCNQPAQLNETEEMINTENVEQAVKVKSVCSSAPELKESEAEQTVDIKGRAKPPQLKTLIGLKVEKHSADAHFSARKRAFSTERLGKDEQVREHTCTNRVHRNKPEAKPNLVGEVKKPHRPVRTTQEDRGSTKASVTKLHSSNHPTRPATSTLGAQNFLYRNQPRQNRVSDALPTLPDKFSTRHTAPSRSSQSQLGRSRTEPLPGRLCSSQKKPQAKLDRTTPIQLGQSSCTERSASTTGDGSNSSSKTFLRRSRNLEEKIAGSLASS